MALANEKGKKEEFEAPSVAPISGDNFGGASTDSGSISRPVPSTGKSSDGSFTPGARFDIELPSVGGDTSGVESSEDSSNSLFGGRDRSYGNDGSSSSNSSSKSSVDTSTPVAQEESYMSSLTDDLYISGEDNKTFSESKQAKADKEAAEQERIDKLLNPEDKEYEITGYDEYWQDEQSHYSERDKDNNRVYNSFDDWEEDILPALQRDIEWVNDKYVSSSYTEPEEREGIINELGNLSHDMQYVLDNWDFGVDFDQKMLAMGEESYGDDARALGYDSFAAMLEGTGESITKFFSFGDGVSYEDYRTEYSEGIRKQLAAELSDINNFRDLAIEYDKYCRGYDRIDIDAVSSHYSGDIEKAQAGVAKAQADADAAQKAFEAAEKRFNDNGGWYETTQQRDAAYKELVGEAKEAKDQADAALERAKGQAKAAEDERNKAVEQAEQQNLSRDRMRRYIGNNTVEEWEDSHNVIADILAGKGTAEQNAEWGWSAGAAKVAEAQEALDKAQAAWDAAKGMSVSVDYSEDDVRKAREAAMAEVEKAEANLKQAEAETGVSAEEAAKAKEKLDAELDYVDSETFKLEYGGMTTEELERVVTDYGMLLDGDAAVYGEGNIKQNELLMAIGYDDEGETTAFDSTIYHDLDTDKYYLVPRYVQDADGNWNYTSRGEAVSAFKSNGLYFGQYDSQDEALKAQAGLTEGASNDFRRYAYWSSTVEELKAERGNILGQLLDVIEDTNIETPEDIDPTKRAELKQQLAELDEALKHAEAMKAEAAKTYNPEDKYEPTREDKIRAAVAKDLLDKRKEVEFFDTFKDIIESDNSGRAIETAIDNAKAELGPTWKEYQDAIDDWKHKLEEEHGGRISDATAKIDFDKNNPDYAKGLYLEYEQAARAYMDEAKASGTKLNDSELRAEFNKEHPEYLQAVKDKEQELQYLKDLRGVAVEIGKDEKGNAIYKADIERDEEYDNKVKDGLSFVDATADIGKLGYDSLNDELEAHGFTEEQIAQFDEYLKKFGLRDALPNDTWTLQEIKTFAYYIGDGDVGRALEFAHDQNKKYADLSKAERAKKIIEFNEAMAQKGMNGNVLAGLYTAAFPVVSGAWTAVGGSLAESIAYYRDAMLAGEAPIRDYNTLTEVFNYAMQGIQQVLSQYETGLQIGDFSLNLGHLYSAYASTIQSFETQFVGGLVGKGVASLAPEVVAALGGADEVVGTITSMYINLAFGGSAMADGAMKAYERTGNMETALWNGFANAVNEGLFESLSLDILFNKLPDATSAVGLLLNGIGQGMVEGSEEFFTDIANNAADWFFNQDMSEWQTKYNALVDQGYTPQEAEVRVKKEMRDSLNESFIVGTLSGGPSAIIKSGVDYAKTVSYGTKIIRNDMMDAVIALGDKVTADPVFNAPSTVRTEAPSNINTEINAEAVGRAAPAEATPVAEAAPAKSPAQQAVETILGGTSSSGKEVSNKNAHEIVDNDDLRAAFTAITGKELKGSFSDMKAAIRSAAAEFKQNQTTATQQNAAQQTAVKATATEEKKPTPIPAKGQTPAGKTEAKGPYAMPETASKKKTSEATPAETIGSRAIKAFGQIKEAYNSRTQAAAEASVKIQAEIDALAPKIKDGTATKDQVKRVAYLEGQQQKTTANMTDLAGKIGYFLQQVYQADPDTFNSWAIKNAEKFSKVSPQSLAQALGAKQHEIQQDADQMAYYYAKQANPGSLVLSNVGSDLQSQYGLSAEVAGNVQDIVGKILRGSTDTSLEEIIKFANGEDMADGKTEEAVVSYIRNIAKENNSDLYNLIRTGDTENVVTRAWGFFRMVHANSTQEAFRSVALGMKNNQNDGTDYHPFAKTEHSVFAEDGRSLNPEAIKALAEERNKPLSERKVPIPVNAEGKTEAKGTTETKKATIPAKGAAKAAAETKVETQKSAPVKVDVEAYRASLPDSVREQVGQTVHIGKTAYNIFSYINNRRAQNSNLTYDMIAEEFSAIRQGVSAEKAQARVAEKYGITTPQETPKTTDNGKPKAPSATPVRSNEDAYRQSSQAPWVTRSQYVADAMAKGATREAANASFDRILYNAEHDIYGNGVEVRRAAPQTTVHTTAQGTVVFDQNVKGLQTEIASLTEQLETLYSEEEMSKARGELFQKQHQTAIQNLEARRARAQADLNKLIERAKVRHNGRVQTHDSGTSGRNGSTDGGRNAGGIPVRGSGSDGRQAGTSGSAGSTTEGNPSGYSQSVRQQEEVILKDGDRTISSMVNGTVLYDSKDPNANTDNLTSEEKDVLNLANEAGVDRLIFVDADQLFGSGNPARAYYVTVGGEKTIVVNANRGVVNGYHETMHYCLDSYSNTEKNALLIEMLSYVFDSTEDAEKFVGIYNNEIHQKVYAPLYAAFLKGNTQPYTLALYEEILCDLWKGLNRYNTPAAQFSSLQQRAYDYVVGKKIIEHATDLAKGNKGAEKSDSSVKKPVFKEKPLTLESIFEKAMNRENAPDENGWVQETTTDDILGFLREEVEALSTEQLEDLLKDRPDDYYGLLEVRNVVQEELNKRKAEESAPVEEAPTAEAPVEETAPAEQPAPTLDLSIGRQRLEQLHQTIHNLSDADLEKQMQEMADILNQLSNDNPDRIILEPVANALVDEYMKRLADSRRESDIINGDVQTTVSDQPATDLPKPNRKPRNKKNQPSTQEAEQTTEATETTEEQPTAPEAEPESTGNPLQDELNKLLRDIAKYDEMIADNIADRNKQMKEAPNKDMKDIIKGEANQLIQLLKNERAELQKQADKLKKQLRKENAKGNKDQRKADLEGHEETGSKKKQKDRPEDHIDNRDLGTVGNTGLNAFQYDHPEVKPYFKRAAEVLMRDLIYMQSSMRSQYNEGTIFGATNNFLEKVRKYFKTSEHAIEACESVIKDSGRENYADPKRVELFLDEMLSDGYKPISPETEEIHSSAEYLKLKGTLTGGTPYDARQKAIQGYLEADFEGTLTQEEAERLVDMNFERTGYYDPNTRDGLAEAPATETTESKDTIGNTEVTGLRTAAEIDAEMDDVSKDIERMIGRLEDVEGQVSPETIQAMQAELKEMEDYYDGLVAELNDAYANGRLSAEDSYSSETPDIYGKFSVESYTNGTGFETMYQIVGTDTTTTLNDWIQDVQRMNPDTKAEQTEFVPTGDPVADLLAQARKESPEAKIDELKLIFSDMVTQGKLKVIGPGERDANGAVHLVDIDNITADRMKESPLGHMITYAQKYGRISETEADRQYKLLAELTKMLYNYDDTDLVWAIVGSEMFSAIKNNSDPQYGKTIDFSTICKKTQATIDAISQTMKLLGTGLSKEEIKFVYKMVGEAGESTPCPVCYVFSRWMGLGSVLDNIKRYQEKYGSKNPHGQEEALKLVQEVQNAAVEKMKSKGGKKLTFGKAVNAAQADVKSKLEAAEKAFQDFEEASKKPNVKKNHDILFDRDGNPLSLDYWAEQIKALADEYDKFDAYKWAIKTRLVNADLLVKSSEDVATRLRNKYKIKGETVEAVLENAANSANNTEEFSELVNELSDTVDALKMIDPERLSKIRQKYHLGKSQSGLKGAITKDKAFGKNFLKDLGKYAKDNNISLLDALKEYEGTNSVGNYYRNLLEYERLANDLGTDSFVFNKKYEDVPDDILFDLNKGEQFAKYYPETWTYRTTRGSGLGKAIMPYSDARVGEIVQGVALGDVKDIKIGEARNAFLDLVNPANKEAADKIIARARTKMAAQNLIGGMRFQSTSDFRYEYASDYLMAFFEMQAMGANVQLYTKVLEAVDFFANVGCDVNLSVMPRDKGIGELTEKPRDWETNYDRYFTLEDGKYVKLKKGNAAPEFEAGKYHAIVYSDVTGVNGGAAREYVQKYDNVQMIMVGISADHINACLDSDDITFVIPFHGSGNSTRDIQQLMNLLGETIDAKNITDFTDYQTDAQKESKNDARTLRHKIVSGKLLVNGNITLTTEEANILETNAFLKDLFRRFYLDATDKNGRVDKAAAENNRENITILNVHEDGTTSVNTKFKIDFGKVNDKAFSSKYYLDGKNECYGNFLSGDAAKQIFPYEYWDKSLKQSEAKGNGDAFQEYCKTLGLIPRFSGWTKDKNYKAELDFTKNDNYWKLLIDRKMYDNQGNYRAQQQINLSNVDAYRSTNEATGKERVSVVDTLNPAYGQVTFGAGSEFANRVNPKAPGKDNSVISKINDPRKRDAIAELCVKAILEARDKSDKSYGHMFSNDADIRQAMENHDYIQAARMIAQNPEIKFNEITGELEVNGRASVDEQAVEAFGDWLNWDTETDGFMSGVIDDNSNYTIDGFFNSLGEEVTVGKFSVDDILSVTYFAGAGTFDYALRDRLFPIYAVEYDPAIRDMFVKNNGNSVLVTDADVNEVNPRTVLAGHVPYFHASPVCTNFSKANNKSGETERDRKFARSIQKGLRAWLPDVFTLENVKGYLGSDSLKIVTDTLDELGYKWDVDVYRTSDYGGATIRDRLFVRAVKNGELPSKPVKTGPTSWWSAVEDIIDTLPVMDESGLTEARRTRLRNMGIDINNLKQPILLLSGTKGREIQYAYADQPSPTLMTDGSEARIILTDGTILKVTPRVYARIQGLDDEFQFPTQKRNPDKIHQSDAFKIIGNGIPTQLTQAVVNPLLDIIDKQNGKYSADDEQMASTLQMYEDLVDPSEWKASEHQNMNEQMYNRISDGISLWDKVVSFYDTVDEDNYNWLSYDDITQAMRINPFNGNIDGEDMPLASEVMWSLLHLARDQKGENKERIYSLMEEIAPHLMRTEQDKWIRPVGSRFPPIDFDFSNWYNERNPMPEVEYTPKSLEQLHQEAIEATNEADFQRRAYRRSLATEDEYNRAAEKARRAWNMYNTRFNAKQKNGKYSVDIDEGSTFDTFGNAIQLDDYNPEVTQSDLSEDVYYSTDGNTSYYQTENGETVVFTNVGENSPEARYINYLEAMNNANANDTTTEPHPIPSATRNEYDGYNNGQSNDGLRRGTEEVLTENQERAFRSAGSNAERNGESRSQSEEPQSVGRFSPEIAPDDPNQFNWFINENGKVITAAEMYPHGSFERSFIDAFTKGDLSKMQDVINELLDGKFKIDDSVFDIIQTILNYDPLFTESERKARVKKVNELRQKYGTQKAAKNDKRPNVFLPKSKDGKKKIMKGVQTTARNAQSEFLSDIAIYEALTNDELSYTPTTNKKALEKADDFIASYKYDFDKLSDIYHSWLESEATPKPWQVAVGARLIQLTAENARTDLSHKLIVDHALMGHATGQALQAFNIIKKLTPSGQLYYLQGVINLLNKKYERQIQTGKMNKIVMPENAVDRALACETREQLNTVMDKLKQEIAEQIPVTWGDRWNAWRYLAMLGNPRTHIRNLLGNFMFKPAVLIKDFIARRLEETASKYGKIEDSERTRVVGAKFGQDTEWMKRANEDYEVMYKVIVGEAGGNKYTDANEILSKRDLWGKEAWWGGKAISWLDELNSSALTAEDALFLKGYYTKAFAEYLQAQGVTEEQLRDSNFGASVEDRRLLTKARAHATIEAQRNTYRDANQFASWLNSMKRKGPVWYTLFEGLVPFTKTPANILARGIEYSPAGLISSVIRLSQDLRSGMTTAEALDRLAAGMTGTMVMGLGLFLSSLGVLKGKGPDDDKEKEFWKLQGHQQWSVELFGRSYTIDWMAPIALPLFVGSSVYDMLVAEKGEMDLEAYGKALAGLADPLSQLSMLDGVNSLISNLQNSDGAETFSVLLGSMLTSYLAQGVPTLLGQVARATDADRRATFIQKGSKNQALQKFVQTSLQAKIPGWEKGKMAYVDNWGRKDTAVTAGDWMWKVFETFFSPGYGNTINTTQVDEELQRLVDATGDDEILPTKLKKYFTSNGEEIDLTADQYEQILTENGQMAHSMLTELINTSYYASLTDAEKVQLIKDTEDLAEQFARQGIDPDYKLPSSWMDMAQQIGPVDYMLIKNDLQFNSTHEQLFTYLVTNPNLNSEQIATIIANEYSAPASIDSVANEGQKYVLTYEDEAAIQGIFHDLVNQNLAALESNPDYINATPSEQGRMIENMYKEITAQTKETYAAYLDGTNRVMETGKASLLNSEAFNKVLDLTAEQIGADYGKGNINLTGRPNLDSVTIKVDDMYYVVPTTVVENGQTRNLTAEEAQQYFEQNHQFFGVFKSQSQADNYGKRLAYGNMDSEGYVDDIAAQSAWLGKKYRADSKIENPDHAGFDLVLTNDQKDDLDAMFQAEFDRRYREFVTSDDFNSAGSRENQNNKIAALYNQVADEVEKAYASELYASGKATEELGTPKGDTRSDWDKNFEIAVANFTNPKDQAEWLANRFTGATTITNPDLIGHNIKLDSAQKAEEAQNEKDRFVDTYVDMVTDPSWKSKPEDEKKALVFTLQKNVQSYEEGQYARYLIDNNKSFTDALDTQGTNAEFWTMLFTDNLTPQEQLDLLNQRYTRYVGTSYKNNTLDYVERNYRVDKYMEYIGNNIEPLIMKNLSPEQEVAAFEKLHKAAMDYAGKQTGSEYGLTKTTKDKDAEAKADPNWGIGKHLTNPLDFTTPYTTTGTPAVHFTTNGAVTGNTGTTRTTPAVTPTTTPTTTTPKASAKANNTTGFMKERDEFWKKLKK